MRRRPRGNSILNQICKKTHEERQNDRDYGMANDHSNSSIHTMD